MGAGARCVAEAAAAALLLRASSAAPKEWAASADSSAAATSKASTRKAVERPEAPEEEPPPPPPPPPTLPPRSTPPTVAPDEEAPPAAASAARRDAADADRGEFGVSGEVEALLGVPGSSLWRVCEFAVSFCVRERERGTRVSKGRREREGDSLGRLDNYDGERAREGNKLSKGCSSPVVAFDVDNENNSSPSYPTLLKNYSPGAWVAAAAERPRQMPRARAGRSGCPQWRGSLFAPLFRVPLAAAGRRRKKKTDARCARCLQKTDACFPPRCAPVLGACGRNETCIRDRVRKVREERFGFERGR